MQILNTLLDWITKIVDFLKWAWRLVAGPKPATARKRDIAVDDGLDVEGAGE